jgi:hypothetical protein
MSNTNTGGPAFPHTVEYKGADCGGIVPHGGMTLRDYFAAKAMQSFTADVGWKSDQQWFDEIAEGAYRQADAMLKAREA